MSAYFREDGFAFRRFNCPGVFRMHMLNSASKKLREFDECTALSKGSRAEEVVSCRESFQNSEDNSELMTAPTVRKSYTVPTFIFSNELASQTQIEAPIDCLRKMGNVLQLEPDEHLACARPYHSPIPDELSILD